MSARSLVQLACFIDTNVWVYAFMAGADPRKRQLAQALIRRERQIVVSTQVVNEVAVNLLKKAAVAEAQLRALITAFYRRYQIIEFDAAILRHASELRERQQLSFWDSLIVASVLASGAQRLYTEDMQNGLIVEGRLTISNPFVP